MECGKEASFWCSFCPFRSKHKHSLLRHLHNRHFTTAAAAEAAADLAVASVNPPSTNTSTRTVIDNVRGNVRSTEYLDSL